MYICTKRTSVPVWLDDDDVSLRCKNNKLFFFKTCSYNINAYVKLDTRNYLLGVCVRYASELLFSLLYNNNIYA